MNHCDLNNENNFDYSNIPIQQKLNLQTTFIARHQLQARAMVIMLENFNFQHSKQLLHEFQALCCFRNLRNVM